MPDPYATIADVDETIVARLAQFLEVRAADPQQRAMLESYLADVPFPAHAKVLDVGCGTGANSQVLAGWAGVASVLGVDPSPVLIARARELYGEVPNLSFQDGDGRNLPCPSDSFDVVVFHTVLCHIPDQARALAEAYRVLKPGGSLAIFDGDYAATTLAIGANDPLQTCADAMIANIVHDPWLVRRLPALVRAAGFSMSSFRLHPFLQTDAPNYMLTVADRGIDYQLAAGTIGPALAAELTAEIRRRVTESQFFGLINYASLVANREA